MSNMFDFICIHYVHPKQNIKSEFINENVSIRHSRVADSSRWVSGCSEGVLVPWFWCFKTLTPDPHRRSPLTCHEGGFILWVRLVSNSHLLGFITSESLGRGHWHGCHNESNQSSVIGRVLWLPSDSHFERLKLGPWGWQLMNIDMVDIVKLLRSNVNEAVARKVCIHTVL